LFHGEQLELNHISDRINAAFNYFIVPMDQLVYEILWKLEEVKRLKKAKAFYDELIVLEELQTKAVLQLLKAKLLMVSLVKGETISKEKLTSEEIKQYKTIKVNRVIEDFKKANVTLIEDEKDAERYAPKKSAKKEPKKSTVQETHELWIAKKTIPEIATIRKLTQETIFAHFTKLIQSGTINIEAVLPADKIAELTEAFTGYKQESVNGLKEQYGDKFTWEELRMFKASLNRN
jgi:uncharacterized protein YpbB